MHLFILVRNVWPVAKYMTPNSIRIGPLPILLSAVVGVFVVLAPCGLAQDPSPASQNPPAQKQQQNPAPTVQNPPRISVTSSLVVVPVTVKDRSGNLVPDLKKDEFRIFDDDVEQQIFSFTAEAFPIS